MYTKLQGLQCLTHIGREGAQQLADAKAELKSVRALNTQLYDRLYCAYKVDRTAVAHAWTGLGIRFIQEIQSLTATGHTVEVKADTTDTVTVTAVRRVMA